MVPLPRGLGHAGGADPFGQMVFKAIQTYGMVVTDYAGAVMLEAEQPSDWAAEGNSGTDPIRPAGKANRSTASWPTFPGPNCKLSARLTVMAARTGGRLPGASFGSTKVRGKLCLALHIGDATGWPTEG